VLRGKAFVCQTVSALGLCTFYIHILYIKVLIDFHVLLVEGSSLWRVSDRHPSPRQQYTLRTNRLY
jgi:hypothetical protein